MSTDMQEELIQRDTDGETWDYFGLSYAHWLVLPRVALQSMPLEWQEQFFALVREMEDTLEYPEGYTGRFAVSMRDRDGKKFAKNTFPHYRHSRLPKKEEQ